MGKLGNQKRLHHLRVPVTEDERQAIKNQAKKSGMSVARFLRDVGMGYQIKGVVDAEKVEDLLRVNADLGRLGGLLKLWLTNDERVANFGSDTIRVLLGRIEETRSQLVDTASKIIMPRASKNDGTD